MTIQSISSNYQALPSMKADFRNLVQSMKALQNAGNTNNQDQVTLSQNALIKAAGQVQNDISSITSATSPGNSNQVQNTGAVKMSALQNDLQTLQNALNSTNQGGSSQNTIADAMSKLENDLSGLKKGHGHHHHMNSMNAANSGSSTTNNDIMTSLAAIFGVATGGKVQSNINSLNVTA